MSRVLQNEGPGSYWRDREQEEEINKQVEIKRNQEDIIDNQFIELSKRQLLINAVMTLQKFKLDKNFIRAFSNITERISCENCKYNYTYGLCDKIYCALYESTKKLLWEIEK